MAGAYKPGRNLHLSKVAGLGYGLYALGLFLHAFRTSRLLGLLSLYFACKAIIHGRRLRAEPAEQLLARDPRAPVLYLRSFSADEVEAPGSQFKKGLILKTTEEQLALAFNHIGPFVAIARPGDELPQLGAARLSFATEQWQERVLMLLGRAQLVVLHLGSTEGFWWEVDAVLAQADLRHVLFFVPLGGGSTYQRLADLVRTRHGIEIPTVRVDGTGDKEPDAHFLHFDETGKPYLLHVWPEFWKKGIYSERAVLRSLGPVFEQFGLDRPHLPMHPYLRWLVLFLIPTALFYWNLSYQPRIREAKDRLAVVQARIGVYELSRNLERLSSSTGELPAADKWTMALDRAGLIPDSMLQGYKAHSAVLLDPWGFPYHYKVPGLRNPGGFDLFSLGADGKEGGGGISADVGNWEPNP